VDVGSVGGARPACMG